MIVLFWYDYVIFAITLLICLAIGIYFSLSGGRQRSTREYLQGDRSLSVFPVAASIALSWQSAITVIGGSAEFYVHGVQRYVDTIALIPGVLLSCIFYLPMYYNLKTTSIFEVSTIEPYIYRKGKFILWNFLLSCYYTAQNI